MNPYGVVPTEANILGPTTALKLMYEDMPKTKGCEGCSAHYGEENTHWCCRTQNPSMFYVEFLYVWSEVQKWPKDKRINVIIDAIRNYLSNALSKGCIFYNEGCTVYDRRPFMCRMYGVISDESWNPRWEALKERQGERFEAKPQCNLVQIDDKKYPHTKVTKEDEHKWFRHVVKCEHRIGMTPALVQLHDQPGGPYRTFHDHLLIELFPPAFLEHLSAIRLTNPSAEDIEATVTHLWSALEESQVV